MSKIITLGELLIDLTQQGTDENGNGKFVAYPGGAPANVAVAASRLGAETAFIGKVGDDAFGRSLADTLQKDNVDISGLYYSETTPTTMAIVSVDENGERDFSFYRKPGADIMLTGDESVSAVRKHADKGARILHIGSLSMTDSPAREACIAAVELAKEKGMLISYDPNYRAALWDSEEQAVSEMKSLLPYADILKVSDEELLMLSGTDDFEKGSAILQTMGRGADDEGISLIMVTLGADGVFVRSSTGSCCAAVPVFPTSWRRSWASTPVSVPRPMQNTFAPTSCRRSSPVDGSTKSNIRYKFSAAAVLSARLRDRRLQKHLI